ncbi:MAG TPA: MFS transporter [Anaerolineales bacterium]|nr:MFS transporter [Anaerolineales bacterium]
MATAIEATQLKSPEWESSAFARPARNIRWVLFTAMSLSSAAVIGMATVNAILGAQLGGSPAWAGVPSATILVGSALASPAWGYFSERRGRRAGLAAGLVLGAVGAALAGSAFMLRSLTGFLGGLLLIGVSGAAVNLSRFAAGDVHPPALRARAISTVVLGGAVGSILGVVLVAPSGTAAVGAGIDELVGPYGSSMLLFGMATIVTILLLRPEPRDLGRQVAVAFQTETVRLGPPRPIGMILRGRAPLLAVSAMMFGQVVMVMVMVMTSLHMREHEHPLASISLVIGSHTFGMYAFSVFSGRLADRWGRTPVIAIGAATLTLACLAAPFSPDVVPLAVALFLLGFGWNFCYVGGSALLADQLRPGERARTQGVNDLLVGGSSAIASLTSGLVFAAAGYSAMAYLGAMVALIPLAMAVAWRRMAPAPA